MLTRHIDERMVTLQRQGTISFALSSLGEEACSVASAAALSSDDWLYPQYRNVALCFGAALPPNQYLHHMFCNKEDLIQGRQMPTIFVLERLTSCMYLLPLEQKFLMLQDALMP